MTNIKTPEEIAKEIETWNQCPHGSSHKIVDACPSCGSHSLFIGMGGYLTCSVIGCKKPSVSDAISAKRNANGEKIRELEVEVQRLGNLTIADTETFKIQQLYVEALQKNLDLESKLAEAEKEIEHLKSLCLLEANQRIELEAEAKAVREALRRHGTHLDICNSVKFNNFDCTCGFDRALNSGKGE